MGVTLDLETQFYCFTFVKIKPSRNGEISLPIIDVGKSGHIIVRNLKLFLLISQPKHVLWVLKRNEMVILSIQNTCLNRWLVK